MKDVIVVGGGTSGLAAAYTLERAGAECTVFEKGDFAGGRTYGSVKDGFTLDLGAQFLFTRFKNTFDLMKNLGIADQLVKFKNPMGMLRDGKVHIIYPYVTGVLRHLPSMMRFQLLSSRGKLKASKFAVKLLSLVDKLDFNDPLKAVELDSVSLADYTRKHFGPEILEYVMQPVASALTLGEPEEISAAYGLALVWYFAPGLFTTTKGIGLLADCLAKSVRDLRLSTEVKKIVIDGNKVKGVEIGSGKKKEFIEARNVICATTASAAVKLLPGLPASAREVLSEIKYSACTHVMFATPEKVMGDLYAIATPRKEGLCGSGFTENANKAEGYAPPGCGLVHAFTFGNFAREMLDMTDEEVISQVTRDIQMVAPKFPDETIFTEIFRWKEAVCLSSPGQIKAVQKLKTALRRFEGLHLAGEYFGMPSVESAISSGIRAGGQVLQ
ncbi:MAG: NAD(P)/FAD-dependent oxidoreductase [Actinomycetota bacterium]|nr:NAD(P)/FAD-dependent oxidoreductase [Actinomycetota bacterium]